MIAKLCGVWNGAVCDETYKDIDHYRDLNEKFRMELDASRPITQSIIRNSTCGAFFNDQIDRCGQKELACGPSEHEPERVNQEIDQFKGIVRGMIESADNVIPEEIETELFKEVLGAIEDFKKLVPKSIVDYGKSEEIVGRYKQAKQKHCRHE